MTTNLDVRARIVGGLILLLLGLWILHSYLGLLIWAVVLAITTWPVYRRLLSFEQCRANTVWVALALTLLIGVIILAPLGYGLSRLLQEAQSLGQVLIEAQHTGLSPPAWLETLPWVGSWAKDIWMTTVGTPEAANETLRWLGTGATVAYTKELASQILHRFFGFLITLLVLFFIYRHGESLGRQVLASSCKVFGDTGVRYAVHAMAAVRATVNGLVLVGLGEGLLLGVGYAFAGLGHPAMLGALTGVFAMIPFAAKLIFGACALVLVAQDQVTAGSALFVYGVIVILLADNYVRPSLIGNAVKLPFLWTLLGIFGGLENFGLLGLFLGPTLMAVLISIWRDWIADVAKPEPAGLETEGRKSRVG